MCHRNGKTMTSFKSAQLIASSRDADKVIFLVDRIELGTQSLKEYRGFADENETVQATENTGVLITFFINISCHAYLTCIHIFIINLTFIRIRNCFFLRLCFGFFQRNNFADIFIFKSQYFIWIKSKHILISDSICNTISMKLISKSNVFWFYRNADS